MSTEMYGQIQFNDGSNASIITGKVIDQGASGRSIVIIQWDGGAELSRKEQREMIRDHYNHRCGHEFDCCGCFQSYVGRHRPLSGNRHAFVVHSYRNI